VLLLELFLFFLAHAPFLLFLSLFLDLSFRFIRFKVLSHSYRMRERIRLCKLARWLEHVKLLIGFIIYLYLDYAIKS